MNLNIALLIALVLTAMWTVMTTKLLRSIVGLAITSAILTVLLFRLNSPLAAVFELSVCAGLIPAIFLSTISLARRLSPEALAIRQRERIRKFWLLPVIVILTGVFLSQIRHVPLDIFAGPVAPGDVRQVLWQSRHLDLFGQIVILLGGAFGVVTLLKEVKKHD